MFTQLDVESVQYSLIALLANSPSQAESLLHSLEQAAGGIGLQVNADSGHVYLSRKQRRINREWHQHATSKGMDSNR